ncbi:transglutaminase-like cysteine peptidase [Mesorhizobium sp. B2-4-17]|uniref:transglutaminase-like cysteine peptidase n=1 Tax=Mesorhizobium sp. B2-4-17 TaxID=2589932 RepID=UPI00112A1489|nr:transglutaminase-like cysteine peptidase [Mesorhizobium sp. B2-4-17]TPK85384.1 transglutaminase [Mesorhizobium sp. B2-4-17]
MKKQKNVPGTTRIKLLLLAAGLAGLVQPALAGQVFKGSLPWKPALETVQAPPCLGGISLQRYQSWQPAASYQISIGQLSIGQIGIALNGYGRVPADSGIGTSTAQDNPGIDPMQTATIIPGVFGSVALSMHNFPVSARWAPVYQAISSCTPDSDCGRKSQIFANIVSIARGKPFSEKLSFVNSSINHFIAYKSDIDVYGKLDYWAKPSEVLANRAGDCEDFAILKMTALLQAGIPAQSMSLVVLQDRKRRFFHAVLAVSTASGAFILDSLGNKVLRDSDLPDYQPLYSFSTDRAWIHGTKAGAAQVADLKGNFQSVAPGEGLTDGQ